MPLNSGINMLYARNKIMPVGRVSWRVADIDKWGIKEQHSWGSNITLQSFLA
jgi:hypothetical protein